MKAKKSASKGRSATRAKKGRKAASKKAVTKASKLLKAAKKAAKKYAARAGDMNSQTAGGHAGHVYVFAKSGTKAKRAHVAKKATVDQMRRALGISNDRISSAKSLIKRLEDKGSISRAG
jgi:hypothetical protein